MAAGPPPIPAAPGVASSYQPAPRGPSSRSELEIDWDHPIWPPRAEASGDRTVAIQKRVLSVEEAFAYIRREDPRPLLVLRECVRCTGTEDALLTRGADNEKTFLMSRWFHCVKLPPDVLEEDHPFHALFAGEKPAHLFLSLADGSQRRDLSGAQSRTELWKAMEEQLALVYAGEPDQALGKLSRILDRMDDLDQRILDAQRRFEAAEESADLNERKIADLRRELTELRAQRNELREEAARASRLAPVQSPAAR